MCYASESPTVQRCEYPRAAREHKCAECPRPIARGARHELFVAMWGGTWSRYRTCSECVSLRTAVVEHEIAEGCSYDEAVPPLHWLWESAVDAGIVSVWPRIGGE